MNDSILKILSKTWTTGTYILWHPVTANFFCFKMSQKCPKSKVHLHLQLVSQRFVHQETWYYTLQFLLHDKNTSSSTLYLYMFTQCNIQAKCGKPWFCPVYCNPNTRWALEPLNYWFCQNIGEQVAFWQTVVIYCETFQKKIPSQAALIKTCSSTEFEVSFQNS